jgi:hypothetical protein
VERACKGLLTKSGLSSSQINKIFTYLPATTLAKVMICKLSSVTYQWRLKLTYYFWVTVKCHVFCIHITFLALGSDGSSPGTRSFQQHIFCASVNVFGSVVGAPQLLLSAKPCYGTVSIARSAHASGENKPLGLTEILRE